MLEIVSTQNKLQLMRCNIVTTVLHHILVPFFYYFWISFTIYVPSFCRYLPFCFSFPFEYFVINPKLKLNKTHVFSRVHKHYKAAKSAFSIHSMKKKNARNNKNLKQSKNFSKFYMPGSHTHTLDDHKIE